jgi:hypothetical protein
MVSDIRKKQEGGKRAQKDGLEIRQREMAEAWERKKAGVLEEMRNERKRERNKYIVTCLTESHRYYATLLPLLGNRSISMGTLTTPVLSRRLETNSRKASVGCLATKSRMTRFSIWPSKCYIEEATESTSQKVCTSRSPKLVFVSVRNQKSTVLAVNYRRRKLVVRRVSEVSVVRSLSLYLVVSYCIS